VQRESARRAEAIQRAPTGPARGRDLALDAPVAETARNEKLARVFQGYSDKELRHMADLLDRVSTEIVNHSVKPEAICLQCGIYFRERCLLRKLMGRTCFYQQHRDLREGKDSHL